MGLQFILRRNVFYSKYINNNNNSNSGDNNNNE